MRLVFAQDIGQSGPQIFMYPHPTSFTERLGDDPEKHRWRAQWKIGYGDKRIAGIDLTAHPIVRRTECGAWIDPSAYTELEQWSEGGATYRWQTSDDKRLWKWVSDDGGQAWAKPTREAAIQSLAIRLTRWAVKLRNDNEKLIEAADALRIIRPDLALFANQASSTIGGKS